MIDSLSHWIFQYTWVVNLSNAIGDYLWSAATPLPVIIPAIIAALQLCLKNHITWQRRLGSVSACSLLILASYFMVQTQAGGIISYQMGSWLAPYGISFIVDSLSAYCLLMVAIINLVLLIYSRVRDFDKQGSYFHPLWQFQLMGLSGAFLTADLFNLFVCFEVMLIASYGLITYHAKQNTYAHALRYVVLNLVGSSIFLIGIAILYGVLGTLNMADLALKISQAPADQIVLLKASAYLLFIVFLLKAAILPFNLWLPVSYQAAHPMIAALFTLLSKVGIYAIIRLTTLLFGAQAGIVAGIGSDALLVLSILSLLWAGFVALSAKTLRDLLGFSILASVGGLLLGIAQASPDALSVSLYYMPTGTLLLAFGYICAAEIQAARPHAQDQFQGGVHLPNLLKFAFFIMALGVAGLPPLAGFISKIWLLQQITQGTLWAWSAVIISAILLLFIWIRAISALIWNNNSHTAAMPLHYRSAFVLCVFMALGLYSSLGAGQIARQTQTIAEHLYQPQRYIQAVFNGSTAPSLEADSTDTTEELPSEGEE